MLLQGGPPPAPPAAPRGAGLSARRLCKIRTHQNVEVYGRSEDETPRKCILQAENIMPGSKKLWEEHLFPSEKTVFLPSVEKTTIFSSGNKSSPQSFSVPGIMFPPRRNIYSHIAPPLLICAWYLKNRFGKIKFDELDF